MRCSALNRFVTFQAAWNSPVGSSETKAWASRCATLPESVLSAHRSSIKWAQALSKRGDATAFDLLGQDRVFDPRYVRHGRDCLSQTTHAYHYATTAGDDVRLARQFGCCLPEISIALYGPVSPWRLVQTEPETSETLQ